MRFSWNFLDYTFFGEFRLNRRSKGEKIYEKMKTKWESIYPHATMIAINTDNEQVEGTGDTIEEAYTMAKSKGNTERFYFKRIGNGACDSL